MITADHSKTGNPLMVGGPQIGYFYPGLTYEIDMHAGDLQWRGATSAPFPGYVLIGRGEDFAHTLTSASGDIIDQFVEKLCNGSDTMYVYKGAVPRDGHLRRRARSTASPVTFRTTVHGPVVGYATVDGEKVAISSKRSSYGKDSLDLLYNRRLSNGQVHSPKSFFKAASLTPQTFNSFYIDNKHIAMYTAGLLPIRNKHVDPGLPTLGTGKYEWTGFLDEERPPAGDRPRGRHDHQLEPDHRQGLRARPTTSSATTARSSASTCSNKNLDRLATKKGKWTLASVTVGDERGGDPGRARDRHRAAAQAAAQGLHRPDARRPQQMLDLMVAWKQHGGSRLDRDLDGKIDDPGAAVDGRLLERRSRTRSWRRSSAPQLDELDSLFSRFNLPPSGQYDGWYQYFDRDIRSLLGQEGRSRRSTNSYCGNGKLKACQNAIWAAIAAAGDGARRPSRAPPTRSPWRSDANRERIKFAPGLLPTTMRYTNRPSGIQQVISFNGHR